MRRLTFLVTVAVLSGAPFAGVASGKAKSGCEPWVGKYTAQMDETNSFVGDGKLELTIGRSWAGWTIKGGSSPEILAAAETIRCTAGQVIARFSAEPQHEGRLSLRKSGDRYILDMTDFHPLKSSPVNYIGYAPNAPIEVHRQPAH